MKNSSSHRRFITSAFALLLFMVISFLIYSPVTKGHYLYGEDYVRLWTSDHPQVAAQSFVSYAQTIQNDGRPLITLYYYLTFNKYINTVKSFEAINTVRITGILGIGLLGFVLFVFFKENRVGTSQAFLLSVLICTLPPIQQYLGRLIIIALLYSVLLSALSILILFKFALRDENVRRSNFITAVAAAAVLFIISLCIYQPTATTYWAMAVIPLITMRNEDVLKRKRMFFTVFYTGFASMILYFVIVKISDLYMGLELTQRGSFIWITDIYSKFIWFLKYPLYDALNLWNINYHIKAGLFVGVIIFAGILYDVWRAISQKQADKKEANLSANVLFKYMLILIFMLLSYVSHLIVKNEPGMKAFIPVHRTLIGLEILVVMLCYMSLMNIFDFLKDKFYFSAELKMKFVTAALACTALAAAFAANHNIELYFVTQLTDEYNYIEDNLREYKGPELSKISKIYFIGPEYNQKLSMNYGEFYYRSTAGRLGAVPMVKLALSELGADPDINIEFIPYEDSIGKQLPDDENTLIIDMRKTDFLDEKYSVLIEPLTRKPVVTAFTVPDN
jgi:hypothetical protein